MLFQIFIMAIYENHFELPGLSMNDGIILEDKQNRKLAFYLSLHFHHLFPAMTFAAKDRPDFLCLVAHAALQMIDPDQIRN